MRLVKGRAPGKGLTHASTGKVMAIVLAMAFLFSVLANFFAIGGLGHAVDVEDEKLEKIQGSLSLGSELKSKLSHIGVMYQPHEELGTEISGIGVMYEPHKMKAPVHDKTKKVLPLSSGTRKEHHDSRSGESSKEVGSVSSHAVSEGGGVDGKVGKGGDTNGVEEDVKKTNVIEGRMQECSFFMAMIHECVSKKKQPCSTTKYEECLEKHGIHKGEYTHLVKARYGTFMVNPWDMYISSSILAYGEWSEDEVTMLTSRLRHDDVVIDVGANIGAITVPLAKAVPDGLVISFEPQRITNQILGANAQLNSLSNVVVKRAGAGAVPGSIPVRNLKPSGSLTNVGALVLGLGSPSEEKLGSKAFVDYDTVPIETIDSLGLERLDLIKIDAQGFEARVLKGGAQTIKKYLPDIYMEYETQSLDLYHSLKAISDDYKCYHHRPPLFKESNFNKWDENMFGIMISFNVLCVARPTPIPTELMKYDLDEYKLPEFKRAGK